MQYTPLRFKHQDGEDRHHKGSSWVIHPVFCHFSAFIELFTVLYLVSVYCLCPFVFMPPIVVYLGLCVLSFSLVCEVSLVFVHGPSIWCFLWLSSLCAFVSHFPWFVLLCPRSHPSLCAGLSGPPVKLTMVPCSDSWCVYFVSHHVIVSSCIPPFASFVVILSSLDSGDRH